VAGPLYEILRQVAVAFGRKTMPKLYINDGDGSPVYIAGSVTDGRGKLILTKGFVTLAQDDLITKGALAHEMAHLTTDEKHPISCYSIFFSSPEIEGAADKLAASKVGQEAITAFRKRFRELVEQQEALALASATANK
jgi:hypothetical protein